MAAHSSNLAWEVPWTEEPGGLQSVGLHRVRHGLVTKQQMVYLETVTSQHSVGQGVCGSLLAVLVMRIALHPWFCVNACQPSQGGRALSVESL